MWHGSISAQKESARRPELSAGITATGDTKLAQGLELSKKLLSGKGAWRVHGGGFAGCVQALLPDAAFPAYQAAMDAAFGAGACQKIKITGTVNPFR